MRPLFLVVVVGGVIIVTLGSGGGGVTGGAALDTVGGLAVCGRREYISADILVAPAWKKDERVGL